MERMATLQLEDGRVLEVAKSLSVADGKTIVDGLEIPELEVCHWFDRDRRDDQVIDKLLSDLKKSYTGSDVVSGEFIHHCYFHPDFTKGEIEAVIECFLDWDESDEQTMVIDKYGYWEVV